MDALSLPPLPDKTRCATCGITEGPNATLRRCVARFLIAPKNGEVQRFISFVVKLILNSQKADWPSHKPLWFMILLVIKYHFV